ncbi:hypothetical protein CPC08DRAFT_248451 [Agrocybe pediades]|nr:hypothetical protein CPC08DRAFT_248451 [Agrocybe pediades]
MYVPPAMNSTYCFVCHHRRSALLPGLFLSSVSSSLSGSLIFCQAFDWSKEQCANGQVYTNGSACGSDCLLSSFDCCPDSYKMVLNIPSSSFQVRN